MTGTGVAGSLADVIDRAGRLPERRGFPTVDALLERFAAIEAAHPDRVTSRRIGTSRLGEPIRVTTIAGGPRSVLVVGGVHPNEPIGSWTAIQLAEDLAADAVLRDALDATWHLVPAIDPDGLRLNEGWFAEPGDRRHYARGFYRPAPDEQVEWSFPSDYKDLYFDRVLPETLALMRLIDDVRPDVYASLHNGEMGGVYYYLSPSAVRADAGADPLLAALTALPASLGLPLATGEPESPHLVALAPAIYAIDPLSDAYDYLESLGLDAAAQLGGSSSSEWAARHGTVSLVAELPYWSHPDADDRSPLEERYRDLLLRTAHDLAATGAVLQEVLDAASPHLTIASPFLRASRAFVPLLGAIAEADLRRAERPDADRPATVAERFGREDLVHAFQLRYGGMLLRALEAEATAGVAPPEVRRLAERLERVHAGWLDEPHRAEDAATIPIGRLVGVQYGAVLAVAAAVRDLRSGS